MCFIFYLLIFLSPHSLHTSTFITDPPAFSETLLTMSLLEELGDFQEQDSSSTLYGRDHRTPVFNERRIEHGLSRTFLSTMSASVLTIQYADSQLARLAQSRERRQSNQQMRAAQTQSTMFLTSDGLQHPYELPQTPVPQMAHQQLDSRQLGMTLGYSPSPLSAASRTSTESGMPFY